MIELTRSTFEKIEELHAMMMHEWTVPVFPRLSFSEKSRFWVNGGNEKALCAFVDYLKVMGTKAWIENPDLFGSSNDDVSIANVDRYGLPLRTLFSRVTGLLRSDPYYRPDVLSTFYRNHYRDIYSVPYYFSRARFFSDQVGKGAGFLDMLLEKEIAFDSVLDFGCGMGGMLVPFQQVGKRCVGCDLGADYLRDGKNLGLNLVEGGVDEVSAMAPFDLIIVSHVLEHVPRPKELLKSLRNILSDTGHLLIEVPGVNSITNSYQGDILRYLQNAHLWHFTEATLARLLIETGFFVQAIDDRVLSLCSKAITMKNDQIDHSIDSTYSFLVKTESDFLKQDSFGVKLRHRINLLKKALELPGS